MLEQAQLYLSPCNDANETLMHQTFDRLAEVPDQDGLLLIESRHIEAKRRAGGVVWWLVCGQFFLVTSQINSASSKKRRDVQFSD
jgi:predicted ATPase